MTKAMIIAPILGCLVGAASAFSSGGGGAAILTNLRTTPLVRASDRVPVLLPTQWRSSTPLGIADETAVVAFLRHYG